MSENVKLSYSLVQVTFTWIPNMYNLSLHKKNGSNYFLASHKMRPNYTL